jgi:hypothetical protein
VEIILFSDYIKIYHYKKMRLGVVAQACNHSTQEAEAGGWRVPGQLRWYTEALSSKAKQKSVNIEKQTLEK